MQSRSLACVGVAPFNLTTQIEVTEAGGRRNDKTTEFQLSAHTSCRMFEAAAWFVGRKVQRFGRRKTLDAPQDA